MTTLRQVRDLLTADHVTIDTLPPSLRAPGSRPTVRSGSRSRPAETETTTRPPPLRRSGPRGRASGDRNADLHRRGRGDHRQGVSPGRRLVAGLDRADPVRGAAPLEGCCADACASAGRHRRHARNLRGDRAAIEFRQHHCVAAALGVGVAFKIYYVMAWRAGETNFLQSSLTRAVFFSACTTATAFGSLWFSHHPGTSSMGKLMALSLVTTLSAAVLFQPALLATQRKSHPEGLPGQHKRAEVWQNGNSAVERGSDSLIPGWV